MTPAPNLAADARDGPGPRLLLVDTPSLYFRAFYGVPASVTAPDGSPVNAVRGLLDFLAVLVAECAPTHLVACLDADWRPAFRVAAIPSYKAHRLAPAGPEGAEMVPDELTPQIEVILEVLAALGVATLGVDGYEADDVIGTLATAATMPVDVVTGDRDLFQLVDDARAVRVLYTAKGVSARAVVDEAALTERYGIPGRGYADFALLRGDPSDGLPGVPGVGEKTAAALLTRFGDLAGLLIALDSANPALPASARRKLEAARAYLAVAPRVVRVVTDVPVPSLGARLPQAPRDAATLGALADRWGLGGSVKRVLGALAERPLARPPGSH